jgi:hypothetical protein
MSPAEFLVLFPTPYATIVVEGLCNILEALSDIVAHMLDAILWFMPRAFAFWVRSTVFLTMRLLELMG